jgi:vacuolar protein sorting-associated protein 45
VRPSESSVRLVCDLLRAQTYGETYVYFSSVLPDTHLQLIAENDEHEMVRAVQEMFASFLAVDPTVFTLDLPNNAELLRYAKVGPTSRGLLVDPIVEGLASFLLSVKRRPQIRHQRNSEVCARVANDVFRLAYKTEHGLFDFRKRDDKASSVLLILNRLDDPVTPLLCQWTYQAMIHELLGIKNNRVVVHGGAEKRTDIVVSGSGDAFFKENMFANYGDLGSSVKKLVDDFQQVSKMNKQIDSIEDMARFVESFPEFRTQSGNVSKHVSLMSELSKIITEKSLMAVSSVEQVRMSGFPKSATHCFISQLVTFVYTSRYTRTRRDGYYLCRLPARNYSRNMARKTDPFLLQEIVCGSDRGYAFASLIEQLGNANVGNTSCLKLVLLFALRYEKTGTEASKQINELTRLLSKRNVEPAYLRLIRDVAKVRIVFPKYQHCFTEAGDCCPYIAIYNTDTFLLQKKLAGEDTRVGDLFGQRTFFSRAQKMVGGLKGADNVYTQHTPLLVQTLENVAKGKLRESDFPFVADANGAKDARPPSEIFVFVVGGITYEEAKFVSQMNDTNSLGVHVTLGGTQILNSAGFLGDLQKATS